VARVERWWHRIDVALFYVCGSVAEHRRHHLLGERLEIAVGILQRPCLESASVRSGTKRACVLESQSIPGQSLKTREAAFNSSQKGASLREIPMLVARSSHETVSHEYVA
jgi:hypothetical protein